MPPDEVGEQRQIFIVDCQIHELFRQTADGSEFILMMQTIHQAMVPGVDTRPPELLAFGGYNKLYEPDRKPHPLVEASCWVYARRPFFNMADVTANAAAKRKAKRRA